LDGRHRILESNQQEINPMSVKIENRVGKNLITKEEVVYSMYDVYLDGSIVGLIGWAAGSRLVYTKPVSPIDKKRIEEELPVLIEQSFTSTPYPEIDPEIVSGGIEEDQYYEFDEE
jgi:hypothetical protein